MVAIHDAAWRDDLESLRSLLDGDPTLADAETEGEHLPLHLAAMGGHVAAASLLLDRGASIDKPGEEGETALLRACVGGRVAVVELLLSRGADPTVLTSQGYTVLMAAANGSGRGGADCLAVIRLLLKDGRVAVDARNRYGRTALWWVCEEGMYEVARVLLLEGGADHTIPSSSGTTPTAVAERMGHARCMQLLQWYDGELKKAFLIHKARAVVDDRECITQAPVMCRAKTADEAEQARQQVAPSYLRGRVMSGQPLPTVEVTTVLPQPRKRRGGVAVMVEEEREAVLLHVMTWMTQDLFVELMRGLRYR